MSELQTPAQTFDPVDLAVLSSRFTAIVRAMSNTLIRTGRSVILEYRSRLLVQHHHRRRRTLQLRREHPRARAQRSRPDVQEHEGVSSRVPAGRRLHAQLPLPRQLPTPRNTCILVPVFDDEGRHRFTRARKAHLSDIGNAEPPRTRRWRGTCTRRAPLILPCVKVQSDYQDIEDVIRMCQVRIRVPGKWRATTWRFWAPPGWASGRSLLAGEVGWDRLDAFVEAWLDYSEGRMAEAIKRRLTAVDHPHPA